MSSKKLKRKRFWLIEGMEGANEPFFVRIVPAYQFSEDQMRCLLQRLASKSSLSFQEIVDASGRKGVRTSLLETHLWYEPSWGLSCGPSWEWSARIVYDDEPAYNRAKANERG